MARRPRFTDQEPGLVVLGAATFVTILFVGTAVTDYFVEGPQSITADYLMGRGLVLGATWLIALMIVGYIHRPGR